jgi:hypothetical protein
MMNKQQMEEKLEAARREAGHLRIGIIRATGRDIYTWAPTDDMLLAELTEKTANMRAALAEVQHYNNINSDRDAYLYELIDWALGEQATRPDPIAFGLEVFHATT